MKKSFVACVLGLGFLLSPAAAFSQEPPGGGMEEPMEEPVEEETMVPVLEDFTGLFTGLLWIFSGTVIDDDPESCFVAFGGLLDGVMVGVEEDGSFSFSIETLLPGLVTASAFDADSNESNTGSYYVSP